MLYVRYSSEKVIGSNIYGTKRWYQNDKYHRLDGPAIEFSNGDKCWYINDRHFCIESSYLKEIQKLKDF